MRQFLRLLVFVLGVGLGGLFAAFLAWPEMIADIAEWMRHWPGRMTLSALAFILLASPLAYWLRWMQAARRSREISYQSEYGRISVNLTAIEEALHRVLEGEREVKKAHVRVYEDRVKRAVVIEAAVTLWEEPNITDRIRYCHRLLRRRFSELMPEQDDVQVNLNVHRLTVRPPAEPGKESPAAPAPAAAPADEGPLPGARRRDLESGEHLPRVVPLVPQSEDDLYVGPAYPVSRDEDDFEGGTSRINKPVKKK